MKPIITVDLGFGDSGKGTIVDSLVRKYNGDLVIRYNGGAQCAHTVYNETGKKFTFAQLGSGSFNPGVKTFLSKYVIVNPLSLLKEAKEFEKQGVFNILDNVFIDNRAIVTTPFHIAVNRLREISRGAGKHGSCGMGIGETVDYFLKYPNDTIRVQDFCQGNLDILIDKLITCSTRMEAISKELKLPNTDQVQNLLSRFSILSMDNYINKYIEFSKTLFRSIRVVTSLGANDLVRSAKCPIFEGAQGVLLDQHVGFHPYTTWSSTTPFNAFKILQDAEVRNMPFVVGIIRQYMTRHGAGPLPGEYVEDSLTALFDKNNPTNIWQDNIRRAPFNIPLLKYAIKACRQVDALAITHMDKIGIRWDVIEKFDNLDLHIPLNIKEQEEQTEYLKSVKFSITNKKDDIYNTDGVLRFIKEKLELPIMMVSYGESCYSKGYYLNVT